MKKLFQMRILKLLSNKKLSIISIFLLPFFSAIADDTPIDIWNIEKKKSEITIDDNTSVEKIKEISENSVYENQSDKNIDSIKLDQKLSSKEIDIIGLYDPEDYGLSINMWSNSDGLILKNLFQDIDNHNLSRDASEILNIAMLTNAHYPKKSITENEFLKLKSNWLIKNSNLELIEEYLIKNQSTNLHPELMKHMVDKYLSQSDVKKSCEIFSKIKEPLEDEYLSKFSLYCLINYGKNDEAQLILDLKKN